MTAMKDALNEAGIVMPLNKRVWLYLQDHPNKAAPDVAAVLNMKDTTVASAVNDLYSRSMIERTTEMRRMRAGGRGAMHFIERPVYVYAINPKMRGEYEVLPLPKKEKAQPFPAVTTPREPVITHAPQKSITAAPSKVETPWKPEDAVAGLNLTQCRELFNYLHKIFKE